MKSRKLRVVLATLSAIAVLATAMTGFAAATVTTTTVYNANNASYAIVTTTVTGVNGDVTYLATTSEDYGVSSSGILYIDQKEAVGGTVTFNYNVKRTAIDGINTSLTLGTNGSEAIGNVAGGLMLNNTQDVDNSYYSIHYSRSIYGNGDEPISASITANEGYEITGVKIAGEAVEIAEVYYVPVNPDGTLATVEVEYIEQEADIEVLEFAKISEVIDGKNTVTTVIKPAGDYENVGVTYLGYEFRALGSANGDGYVAVRLVDDEEIDADKIKTYIR